MKSSGFDFDAKTDIDFNVDLDNWPPSTELIELLRNQFSVVKMYEPDDQEFASLGEFCTNACQPNGQLDCLHAARSGSQWSRVVAALLAKPRKSNFGAFAAYEPLLNKSNSTAVSAEIAARMVRWYYGAHCGECGPGRATPCCRACSRRPGSTAPMCSSTPFTPAWP